MPAIHAVINLYTVRFDFIQGELRLVPLPVNLIENYLICIADNDSVLSSYGLVIDCPVSTAAKYQIVPGTCLHTLAAAIDLCLFSRIKWFASTHRPYIKELCTSRLDLRS